MRSNIYLFLVCAATLSTAAWLDAQTQVTVECTKDNTLYDDTVGALSNGAGTRFFCGNSGIFTGADIRRGLIAFDLAGRVPPCARIVSAEVVLTLVRTSSANQVVTLHRTLADWGEGTSFAPSGQGGGGPATLGDATWVHRFFSTSTWAVPGGDFAATASGSTTVGAALGAYTFLSTPQLVADVQSWVDQPATNSGWTVRTDENGSSTAKAFATREAFTVTSRPRLQIGYLPPSASTTPVGAGCNGSGSLPLVLTASGLPVVPTPGFSLSLLDGPSQPFHAFVFALLLSPVPLPIGNGCFVYFDPSSTLVSLSGNPSRSLAVPIPNDPLLLGAKVVVQGLVLEPLLLRVATSNALELKLGQ